MTAYYSIRTEKGQNLYDISIQEYGSVHGVWWLLEDNPESFPEGLCSVMPAGIELKIRDEKPVKGDIQKYLRELNLIVNTNIDDSLIPEMPVIPDEPIIPVSEVIIVEPDETKDLNIAPENAEAVFLNFYLKEQIPEPDEPIDRFAGTLRVINDFVKPYIAGNEYSGTRPLGTEFDAGVSNGFIILKITAPADKRVYFKRHVITVL